MDAPVRVPAPVPGEEEPDAQERIFYILSFIPAGYLIHIDVLSQTFLKITLHRAALSKYHKSVGIYAAHDMLNL